MNELVSIMRNDAVVSSLQIAEHFGKEHGKVLKSIEKAQMTEAHFGLSDSPFRKSYYKDESGKKNPMYYLTRDGFSFVVMGFTGKKAAEWKWKYIAAFNSMEKIIRERLTLEWRETRASGKLTRKAETDIIQKLIEYAKEQGSQNSNKLYIVYSRLANKAAGVKCRDVASIKELNHLEEAEDMILKVIRRDMEKGLHYKEIYQNCKRQLESWQEILMVA